MKKLLLLFGIAFYLNTNAQTINTIAGGASAGSTGDGGAATAAKLNSPTRVALDNAGNLLICDRGNNRIRKVVVSTGVISNVVGTGTANFSGDDGAATAATLNFPNHMIVDTAGNIYITDAQNQRIRMVTASTGIITTVAGTGTAGYSADGVAATSAKLNNPYDMAFDPQGNLYVADRTNNRIRKITISTGIITTVVGTGTAAYSGDGAAATAAGINNPIGLAIDAAGNIFVGDFGNIVVRRVDAVTGKISTIAGNGTNGFSGDGGQATAAQLSLSSTLSLDANGNVYVSDVDNYRIRKVIMSTGIINTVAGIGTVGFSGDGGAPTAAQLNSPGGTAADANGSLYITDQGNNRIREIINPCPVTFNGVTNICSGTGTILTASGASSYTWSANAGSANTNTVSVSPTGNTTYTVTSVGRVCVATNTISVTVTTTPTLTVSGDTTLCSGSNTTLSAGGATSYTWTSSAFSVTTQSVSVSPNTDDTFTVTAANGNCTDVQTVTIHVTATPTLSISGVTNICSGTGTQLTAIGATTYNWSANAGSAITNTVSVSPNSNDTYTLTGANGLCAVTKTVSVQVTATPSIAITATNSICSGNALLLSGSGATTFTWSANANNAVTNSVTINPTATDTYTLTGANGNCLNTSIATVTVIPLPVILSLSDTICPGNQATLHASGASTYTWNPVPDFSTPSGSSVISSPTLSTTYTITGTATTSCVGTATVAIVIDCTPLAIKNISTKNEINLYPNPAQNNFTIETSSTEKQTVNIFDVSGKQVLSQTINGTTTIDASALNAGVYSVNIIGNNSTINKKLIIVK